MPGLVREGSPRLLHEGRAGPGFRGPSLAREKRSTSPSGARPARCGNPSTWPSTRRPPSTGTWNPRTWTSTLPAPRASPWFPTTSCTGPGVDERRIPGARAGAREPLHQGGRPGRQGDLRREEGNRRPRAHFRQGGGLQRWSRDPLHGAVLHAGGAASIRNWPRSPGPAPGGSARERPTRCGQALRSPSPHRDLPAEEEVPRSPSPAPRTLSLRSFSCGRRTRRTA